MEKTIKDHLVDTLDDLESEDLRKFKSKLCDRKVEPRVRRGKLDIAKFNTDLVDLLINIFTARHAVSVTLEILTAIGCNQVAEDLRRNVEGNEWSGHSAPQPFMQDNTVTPPQGSGGATVSPPGGHDQPDACLMLLPCSLSFKDAIFREKGQEVYPILDRSVRKRLALLINNIEFDVKALRRRGAQNDGENMEKLLDSLGYDVVKHTNLSGQEIDEALKSFAGRSEHAESDSTFVVIMSHGKRDKILGVHYKPEEKDPDIFPVDNIYTRLNTANCPALRHKPKVILIQACRGGEDGAVWVSDSEDFWIMESDDWEHKERDFISLLSCTPDTVSYRSPVSGALFIRFLVEVFNTNAHKDHIEELFRQVMRRFEKFSLRKQMVCKDRTTLLKLFYLFPGL